MKLSKNYLFAALILLIVVAGLVLLNRGNDSLDWTETVSPPVETEDGAAEPAPKAEAPQGLPVAINLYRMGDGESELALFTFKELAKKYQGRAIFQNIDVEKRPEIASYYKIESVPIIIIKAPNRKITFRSNGYVDEEELVRRLSAAGMR